MAKVFIEESSLTAIGDAIRAKAGTTDVLTVPNGMVDAINSIETSVDESKIVLDSTHIFANGTYVAPTGRAYNVVTVDVGDPTGEGYWNRETVVNFLSTRALLETITIPPEITYLHDYAFYKCTAANINGLPEVLRTIGAYAFYQCQSLDLTTLPPNLVTIGQCAFQGCTQLSITSIPYSVTTIGDHAFMQCQGLRSIRFEGTPNTIGYNIFEYCMNLTDIYVPWSQGRFDGDEIAYGSDATVHFNS